MSSLLKGAFVVCIAVVGVTGAAMAAVCDAGKYLGSDGRCVLCDIGHYCPGDDEMHVCGEADNSGATMNDSPYYADEQGMSECKKCPVADDPRIGTIKKYWFWEPRTATGDPAVHTQKEYCRAIYVFSQKLGTFELDCSYTNGGTYDGLSDYCQFLVTTAKCDAGYHVDTTRDIFFSFNDTGVNIRFKGGLPTAVENQFCTLVPIGYYQSGGSIRATACPDGKSTHITGATSESACVSLCGAGATKLHAGSYSFNIWSGGSCTSPAINVGLSGGTCCVNLESGAASGLNIKYNGNTYHAVN